MGKNFSCNNSGGKRKKSDFYETPYSITQSLIDVEGQNFNNPILEPSCGQGAISKILIKNGYEVVCQDLDTGHDFLKETKRYDNIVTNPPFSISFEFIKKCKELSNYFALLLPLSYLHGKKRFDEIYMDRKFPLKKVYVFTRYPMLGEDLREDGCYNTGMMVYAWFIWDKHQNSPPTLDWIDNNDFVISSKRPLQKPPIRQSTIGAFHEFS
jgi:hypothetical protein